MLTQQPGAQLGKRCIRMCLHARQDRGVVLLRQLARRVRTLRPRRSFARPMQPLTDLDHVGRTHRELLGDLTCRKPVLRRRQNTVA